MENSKRKGIISILIIAVCLCLCIGATYAYFTDSATSKGNKIQAGKLKVDLELLDKDTSVWNSIKESQAPIFYHEKWEPGYTDVKILKVENEETLAIKWQAKFLYEGQLPQLANAIEVYVKASDSEFAYPTSRDDLDSGWVSQGTLAEFAANISTILKGELLSGESDYFGIALYMPTTVEDNTLQGQSIDPFDIQILATQLSYESDAFDEKYDENAGSSNGGVTPPSETESESDTTTSSSEPDPTEAEPTETEPTDTSEPTEPAPEPTDSDIFTWDVYDDYAVVTGLKNPGTVAEINIPSTYNGLPVTGVGNGAFSGDSTITSVIIPEGVTTIGSSVLSNCSNLQTISVPDSITYIGGMCGNCDNLQYNEYDNAHYLGNDSNPYVVLMEATSDMIESCIINESTKIIYPGAFLGCFLTSIDIPDSVTQIGGSAFYMCNSLANVELSDSLITIGAWAFFGCGLKSITIPDGVTTIDDYAFRYASLTGELNIPNSVITIGTYAFDGCGFTKLTIGNNATIGDYAFTDCGTMTSITVAEENPMYYSINNCLIERASNTLLRGCKNSIIPNTVTTIGEDAFSSCYDLTSIDIPNSVTTIGNGAFCRCRSLTSVTIPDSVTTIGDFVFFECEKLTSLTIPNTVTTIGDRMFYYCSNLTSVTIPNSVTTIGDSAFRHCSNLTSVTIPDSVTTIGSYAFYDCDSLTSVTIPDSVTTIGDNAFYDCYNLTSVAIGDSVTTIGYGAFEYCYKLVEVINKSSLTITAGSSDNGYVAFYAKEVHNGTTKIVNQNNYLFYTYNGVNYLLGYVGTDTALTLPENYNGQNYEIYQYTFYLCDNLTSITIPDSVTTIGDSAFYWCSNLTSVTIPNSVTTISDSAFGYCSSLTSVTIPDSVTTIGDRAFQYCRGLTGDLVIPNSVTTIGDDAFAYCTNLTSVTIPDSVTTIGDLAFSNCDNLTSVTISDSVTTIGDSAFSYCRNLTSITFDGTIEQWNAIEFGYGWDYDTSEYTIYCTNGTIAKDGTVTYY